MSNLAHREQNRMRSLIAAAALAATMGAANATSYSLSVSNVIPANDGEFSDAFVSNCYNCNLLPYDPQGIWVFDQAGIFNQTFLGIAVQPDNGGNYLSVYGTASLYLFPSVSAHSDGISFVWGTDDSENTLSLSGLTINGQTIAPFTPDPTLQGARDVLVTLTGLGPITSIEFDNHRQFAFELDNLQILHDATAAPEPSTWAMLMLGFAGLGFMGFKRSRSARLATID